MKDADFVQGRRFFVGCFRTYIPLIMKIKYNFM